MCLPKLSWLQHPARMQEEIADHSRNHRIGLETFYLLLIAVQLTANEIEKYGVAVCPKEKRNRFGEYLLVFAIWDLPSCYSLVKMVRITHMKPSKNNYVLNGRVLTLNTREDVSKEIMVHMKDFSRRSGIWQLL